MYRTATTKETTMSNLIHDLESIGFFPLYHNDWAAFQKTVNVGTMKMEATITKDDCLVIMATVPKWGMEDAVFYDEKIENCTFKGIKSQLIDAQLFLADICEDDLEEFNCTFEEFNNLFQKCLAKLA
jgi:hypothetical protein